MATKKSFSSLFSKIRFRTAIRKTLGKRMFGSRPAKVHSTEEDGYVRFDKNHTNLKCAYISFTEIWNGHQIQRTKVWKVLIGSIAHVESCLMFSIHLRNFDSWPWQEEQSVREDCDLDLQMDRCVKQVRELLWIEPRSLHNSSYIFARSAFLANKNIHRWKLWSKTQRHLCKAIWTLTDYTDQTGYERNCLMLISNGNTAS